MAGEGTTSASDCHLDKVAISIHRGLEGLSPPSNCCIFTVPERLRRTNQEAYTPRVVAIGPYHRLNPSLKLMEDHKLLYLQNFLQHDQNYRLEDYIQSVKSWEYDARNCYDKKINLDSDQFVEMMLLDGIFVIQLFLMRGNPQMRLPDDRIFREPWMFSDVRCDMALLENQIPFFVIQRLFEMAFKTHQQPMRVLHQLVCLFFKQVMRKELPESAMESEVKHFVHVISLSFSPLVSTEPENSDERTEFNPSAMKLAAAGVKLKKGESECLFDIKFKNGVLTIPYLALHDSTEYNFRNIIAFEQCYCTKRYLTDYMTFMHHLVQTPDDAELLIDKKIIKNWLSNREAATQVINTFGKENVLSTNYYFSSLCHELGEHCNWPYNKWKATFKSDYCSSPWKVISVIAAVVLLLLTGAQTVCSVLSLK